MDLMTAEEAYKISMENIPEQVKNVVDKMRFEILHSCDLGYTSAEMHIDPRLGNNPAFLTAVYKAFEEKNYNVYLVEGEEDGRYKLAVLWEPYVDMEENEALENAKAV